MTPSDRPKVPADLRRRVLVEAGHRCAIHTCRNETVDVHHIDGWAASREHRFDSLIALCPTCHRRADAGEIDRKSLRLYKARLAAAFRFLDVATYPKEEPQSLLFAWSDPAARWRTLVMRDSDADRKYRADIEYPEFAVVGSGLSALNSVVFEAVQDMISWFRREAVYAPDFLEVPARIGFEIEGSFSVALISEELASMRFGMYSYADGAHGSHWTRVVNASLQPFATLSLRTLFTDVPAGLALLSEHCYHALMQSDEDGHVREEEWVRSGTAPEERNFDAFNLSPEGIVISFDDYHVGPYAAGPSDTLVPYEVVKAALAEPVASYARRHASNPPRR